MDSKNAFYHNSLEKLRVPYPKLKNDRNLIAPESSYIQNMLLISAVCGMWYLKQYHFYFLNRRKSRPGIYGFVYISTILMF